MFNLNGDMLASLLGASRDGHRLCLDYHDDTESGNWTADSSIVPVLDNAVNSVGLIELL